MVSYIIMVNALFNVKKKRARFAKSEKCYRKRSVSLFHAFFDAYSNINYLLHNKIISLV